MPNTESSEAVIRNEVQTLADVLGKNVTPALEEVYVKCLSRFSFFAIRKAFQRAQQEQERWPTPKRMITLCGECEPPTVWQYDYRPAVAKDPETGATVNVLIDPTLREGDPKPVMYRAHDCPEGRAFLKALRGVLSSKKFQTDEQLWKERTHEVQTHKVQVLKGQP